MDGSDDYYFSDDIILDDQTLAVLDSEEQKYLTQAVPPPAKRQKTDKGWKPAAAPARATVLDDNEDLPEISVHGDGTYAFRGANQDTRTIPPAPNKAFNVQVVPQPPVSVPTAHSASTQTRPDSSSRPRNSFPQSATHARIHAPARPRAPPRALIVSDALQAQDDDLRKQIEELRRENQKCRVELKDATDAKYLKQGEVTILRQGIEKAAQDHAAQVAKLKLAKEESEAKQIELQKEMKAEMERLKTQFIFKQHELESSSRKPPLSVRSKRISKDVPSTPMAVPSQIRGWTADGGFPEQSPVQARIGRGSPKGSLVRRTPEKSKKPTKLLGFQNSFIDVTPIRSAPSRSKQETDIFPPSARRGVSPTSPIPFPQQFDDDIKMPEAKDFGDEWTKPEGFDSGLAGDVPLPNEELDGIEPFNWKAELTRIMLTHTFPRNSSPTFKILVALVLPPDFAERYSDAVTRVLELVASTSQQKDYEASLSGVCQYLTLMIKILNSTNLTSALAALLDLSICLSCSLPMFTTFLLAQPQDESSNPGILEVLCSVVRDHLQPSKYMQPGSPLGNETISLLEALCWNLKDDLIFRLEIICNSKDVLMILLDTAQPSWLHGRSVRLLAFLATHPTLSRALLLSSEGTPLLEGKAKDASRLPHIERLCSYLIDASRKDSEAFEMKRQILTFFAILSVAHTDVHTMLVGCPVLIPSVVAFLTQMTTLLWEGDEFLMTSSETIITIRTLNQTLFLLHHLVLGLEPNFNLRHRLHYAPSRTFNGITHMFIVTFGRLSCADPPEWIDPAQKIEVEAMSEMAQDLLDLVVDGPEGDSIWAAYQADNGSNSDTDEEDMEAKLLGNI